VGLTADMDMRLDEKSFASAKDRTLVAQSVVGKYNDLAAPVVSILKYRIILGVID
jgi:hypothetical protein